ncbi:MAG: hypothetical protein WC938_00435 [Candidatus Paceibacterota bacterium]|jgi:hypothetical protein
MTKGKKVKIGNEIKTWGGSQDRIYIEETKKLKQIAKDNQLINNFFYHRPYNNEPISVMSKIRAEKEELKNKALDQDIRLKGRTLNMLFAFLGIETIIIFSFSFLQATKIWGFGLEEWSFKLLIVATILQITCMLQLAVKHLFPITNRKDN